MASLLLINDAPDWKLKLLHLKSADQLTACKFQTGLQSGPG